MIKKVIAVLFGGQSSEHQVSKISASTIISNLSTEKYQIIPIYITTDGNWKIYEGPIQNIGIGNWEEYSANVILSPDKTHKGLIRIVGEKITFIPVDLAFPVLHGKYGEDGTVQGLLELAGIPYVGCKVASSAICMDKEFTKIIVESIGGINQAKYKIFHKENLKQIDTSLDEIENELGFPCFVKPANAGSSIGVSKAADKSELKTAINSALDHDKKVVVEQFIDARELECAVLGCEEPKASCVGEAISATDFYDFDSKYNNAESKTEIPAKIGEEISEKIKEQSIKIFKALNASGLSRVDFFLEKTTNKIIFNEINTLPGFTSISMYHMLWAQTGIKLPELLDKLIDLALENEH